MYTRDERVERRKRKRERIYRWLIEKKRQRGCASCRQRDGLQLTLDHIIPRYLGGRPKRPLMKGRTSWSQAVYYWWHPNIQVLCNQCHKKKTRDQDPTVNVPRVKP